MIIFRCSPFSHRYSISLLYVWSLVCLFAGTPRTSAQDTMPVITADQQIAAAIARVSAEHIRANITRLVSFQNRSTLSAQDSASIAAGHGVGAARDWIKAEFESYSRDCGGCLEVKVDSFIESPTERIPKPTQITNGYAIL